MPLQRRNAPRSWRLGALLAQRWAAQAFQMLAEMAFGVLDVLVLARLPWWAAHTSGGATRGQRMGPAGGLSGWRGPMPGALARRERTGSVRRRPLRGIRRTSPPAPGAGLPRVTRCHRR